MAVNEILPPGTFAELPAPSKAPEHTHGGFSYLEPGDELQTTYVWDDYLGGWQEKFVTPCDQFGLPYCFVPTKALPAVNEQPECHHVSPIADFNHQFPKHEVATSANSVLDEQGGAALINSRAQWVDYEQHHDNYHPFFVGSRLPNTRIQLLTVLLLTSCGYVPENGLDMSKIGHPEILALNKKTRKWLWTSGQVRGLNEGETANYLRNHVLDTEFDHIDERKREEFLYTYDYDRRVRLGLEIAKELVERAVEPLEPTYQSVRRAEVLTFARIGGTKKAPPQRAAELTLLKVMHGKRVGSVLNDLHTKLSQGDRRPFMEYFEERMAARAA